ncbi:hypothetical protein SPRG_05350 [Saprolegnia parasitica CBS 223.65]|uniref:Peptidase S54 rhomboid domain-containing protein n=1 Tax=Saprolegnia parasitica (strain CBS 223.65) TaxID=695850 RepID=A0A067CI29_SAPPC|nr:hypothetical protein SPRG_05350 [Saprolegnia parasitica CBS 223.65]KDO30158.1 hypothetical protein SPRG_05350 [Saprolegnia parasitica CBS 223.65]|eukprot:XP_012199336.1 hypothetical protein SPRG_05350 [Saprolegnia parasitica CBS 223.65]
MGLLEDVRAPVTLGIVVLIPLLWLLGALLTPTNQHGVFALSIASVILEHIRPWAYLTAPFYHQYLWEVVCIVPLTVLLGVRVEKHLGSLAMARLVLFVGVVSTGLLFCDMFALYIVFRNPFFLRTGVSGFTGGLVALLVALTHENPNQTYAVSLAVVTHVLPLASPALRELCLHDVDARCGRDEERGAHRWRGAVRGLGLVLWLGLPPLPPLPPQKPSGQHIRRLCADGVLPVLPQVDCRRHCDLLLQRLQAPGFLQEPSRRCGQPPGCGGTTILARAMKALDEKLAKLANPDAKINFDEQMTV